MSSIKCDTSLQRKGDTSIFGNLIQMPVRYDFKKENSSIQFPFYYAWNKRNIVEPSFYGVCLSTLLHDTSYYYMKYKNNLMGWMYHHDAKTSAKRNGVGGIQFS